MLYILFIFVAFNTSNYRKTEAILEQSQDFRWKFFRDPAKIIVQTDRQGDRVPA